MKKALLAVGVAVVVALVGFGSWAAFASDDETSTRGMCGTSAYDFGVESDDNALDVTFELQAAAPGETWTVVIEQDGTPILTGDRQTDEDAELDVDAVASEDGGDEFTVTATPAAGGEACTATVTR